MAFIVPLAISLAVSAATSGIQYLLSSKRKLPPTERGRNDDIRIMGSDYGAVIPRIWGRVRIAPQLLYSTQIRPVVTETQERTSGGKGGAPRQTVRTYNYYTTLFLAGCANQVNSIDRIWANSDVIYNMQPDPNLHYYEGEEGTRAGGATITSDAGCSSGNKVTGIAGGGTLEFADLPAPNVPTDTTSNIYTILTVYYKSATTKTLYVSVDNGTPVAYSCEASPDAVQTKTIYLDNVHPESIKFSNAGASAPDIDRISVWFSYTNIIPSDLPVSGIYDEFIDYPNDQFYPHAKYNYRPTKNLTTGQYNFQTVNAAGVRIYTGTETQTADSAIIADLDKRYGAGNGVNYASAYRGIAGVVLEDYQVPNGNLPNFTLELNQGTTSVAQILNDLYAIKNIDSSYLDTTALSGKTLSGLIAYQLQTPQSIVEQLETWFNFKMVSQDGKIKAVLRNQAPIATITGDDLRAHDSGEKMPEIDALISPINESKLPREVWVSHLDPSDGIDYKNNAQTARLYGSTLAEDVINLSFPFVSTPQIARDVAESLLLQYHTRHSILDNLFLMPKFAKYTPGDNLTLQLENASVVIEIIKKTFLIGGKVQIEATTSDEFEILTNVNTVGNQPDVLSDTPKFPANTELQVFESVPIDLTHEGLGVYVGVCGKGVGKWNGCAFYNRINADDDWIFTRNIESRSPIGAAQDVLGNHTGTGEDTTNSIEIYFFEENSLETVTAGDLDANPQRNLIRIGDEWVQFRTATAGTVPAGSNYKSAWTISNLRRGLFKTELAKPSHQADEICVVYSTALQFVALDSTYSEAEVFFTAPSFGQSTDVSAVKSLTIEGLSTGGKAPTDLLDRIGSNPLTLTIETAPNNTQVSIRVTGYSETARFRKIYVSPNSDMSGATLLPIVDANNTGGTLDAVFTYTKSSETSAVHRYFKVEQSINGIDYKQVSNVLDVEFQTSGGSGGSGTLTKPVITVEIVSEDSYEAEVEITITTAGSGTGNYIIERSPNSGASWSEIYNNATSPYSDTVFKPRYGREYSYRVIRANESSLYSDPQTIYVEGSSEF